MKKAMAIGWGLVAVVAVCASAGAAGPSPPQPLVHAHAHNDYAHKRPLFDALDNGFCSVEADIWLVKDRLLVAHTAFDLKTERTLQSLYLDPLRARVRKNGGRVYANGPECTLLIDLKSDWKALYPALREVLKQYDDILTTFGADGQVHTNAVRAIISGDRAKEMFEGEKVRYAAYDGGLEDVDSTLPASFMPWISGNWSKTFHWKGTGPFPEDERKGLKEVVAKAHAKGRRVRFWATPDMPRVWRELIDCGVDLINTDDLAGFAAFSRQD